MSRHWFFLAFVLVISACAGGSGGASQRTATAPAADEVAPVISVVGTTNLSVKQNAGYSDAGASATDSVDGDLDITISGTVDTSTIGEYTITYTAIDRAGNTSSVTRTVTVVAIDISIDSEKWFHQTQLLNGSAWYNNEQQHYTNRTENSFVSDGTLKIFAEKESFTDQDATKNYTSARLNSKYSFTYGRIEVRAKLPISVGT